MRAFRIAYDGTDYRGFQRQPDVPTVENELFDALCRLGVYTATEHRPTGYAAAGRTDAGVSALAQTVGLEAPEWLTPRALNAELPADVRAWAIADAPDGFHATHHAVRRQYTYYCYAPRGVDSDDGSEAPASDVVSESPIDERRFQTALDMLSGTHDYANLTPDDEGTCRTVDLEAERDGPFLVVSIEAGGFSRQLVRRLISLVSDVGRGKKSLETVERVLTPTPLPGHEGIPPAPARPLVLTAVEYPDLSFEIDRTAAESARSLFESRRVEQVTGARVMGRIHAGIERTTDDDR